jgi:endonuclease YncB( thermonuclease family)
MTKVMSDAFLPVVYGRTLATVYLRDRGDVGMVLVRDGLARFWSGRRMPWYWPFLSAMNVP